MKTAAKVLLFFDIHKFSPLFSLLFGIFSFLLLRLFRVSLGLCSVLCLFPSSGIGGLALRCPLAYNPAPHPARGRLVSSPSGTLSIAPVFDTGISKCRPARPRAASDVVHRLACHAGVPVSFIVPSGRRLFFVNSRRLYVSVTDRPPLSSSITPASYAGLLLLLPLSGECHSPLFSSPA